MEDTVEMIYYIINFFNETYERRINVRGNANRNEKNYRNLVKIVASLQQLISDLEDGKVDLPLVEVQMQIKYLSMTNDGNGDIRDYIGRLKRQAILMKENGLIGYEFPPLVN